MEACFIYYKIISSFIDTSERVYESTGFEYVDGWEGGPVVNVYDYAPLRVIEYGKLDEQVKEYLADYGLTKDDCVIVEPYKYINAKGEEVEVSGSIQGFYGSYKYINHDFQTVTATPRSDRLHDRAGRMGCVLQPRWQDRWHRTVRRPVLIQNTSARFDFKLS